MSRGNYREPRRRGFDDDFEPRGRGFSGRRDRGGDQMQPPFAPSGPLPGFGPVVDAVVKWFNPEKGFGFVELSDGTGDAFLHIRALEAAGHATAASGTKLRVRTGQGAKGPQVTEVLELDASTAEPVAPRARGPRESGPRFQADRGPAVQLSGTVKWYNPDKGFGFVAVGDGGKDVFVHASALRRAGLAELAEGQRVTMEVVEGAKGREAASIAPAD